MRKADEEAEIISDWKFAAMVVDRSYIFYYFLFPLIERFMMTNLGIEDLLGKGSG
jgi:hypothetical protein